MTTDHAPRDYSRITLPYRLPHWELGIAIEKVRPYWDKIPQPVAHKINLANNNRTDLVLTKEDFDLLPNDVWDELKKHL